MLNHQSKKIADGAIVIALFMILTAISYYVPFVYIITYLITPLPIAWFSAKYDRNYSFFVAITASAMTFLLGGIFIPLNSIIFAAIGFVIGDGLRTKKSKLYIYLSTAITVLISFSILYVILEKVFAMDFIQSSLKMVRESYEASLNFSEGIVGQTSMSTEELIDYLIKSLEIAMPSIITLGVFLFTIIVIAINFPILKRLKIDTPKFQTFSNLRLPRIVLWLYFLILLINLFANPEFGSNMYVITLNFSIVLWVLLTLQGVSFIHFCIDAYTLPKPLKVVTSFIALPLYSLFILIGIIDLGFNVRSLVKDKTQK